MEALRIRMSYLRKPEGEKRGTPRRDTDDYLTTTKARKTVPDPKPMMPSSQVTDAIIMPVGEDNESLKKHYKRMTKEMKNANPNSQIVSDLFRRTFPLRRNEILEAKTPFQKF